MKITDTGNRVKKYIGIDIGGMSVKGMILRGDGTELCKDCIETGCKNGGSARCDNIVTLINRMIQTIGGYKTDIKGVGIGCPGLIDSKNGFVVFSGNLGLKYFPLQKEISDKIGLPVKITNDAHAAALGEAKFGAGRKYKDSILVTLGTGVGGGIVGLAFLFFEQTPLHIVFRRYTVEMRQYVLETFKAVSHDGGAHGKIVAVIIAQFFR